MRKLLTILAAIMALALPAYAVEDGGGNDGGWISCMSVNLTWSDGTPAVASTNGDWFADGSVFALDFVLDGTTIQFMFPEGSSSVHQLDPSIIDASACEDGSVFLNAEIIGQEPSWDTGDSTPPEPETAEPEPVAVVLPAAVSEPEPEPEPEPAVTTAELLELLATELNLVVV